MSGCGGAVAVAGPADAEALDVEQGWLPRIDAFAQNNGHLNVTDARYVNALKLFLTGVKTELSEQFPIVGTAGDVDDAINRHMTGQARPRPDLPTGDFDYREFHSKDGISGLQYWRVTGEKVDLGDKDFYDIDWAE
mgnify:CR=1 FL=1